MSKSISIEVFGRQDIEDISKERAKKEMHYANIEIRQLRRKVIELDSLVSNHHKTLKNFESKILAELDLLREKVEDIQNLDKFRRKII